MRILVTGGSGFVGKHLVPILQKKHQVFHPSSTELNLIEFNYTNSYIKELNFDCIIHLAATGVRIKENDSEDVFQNNLLMFNNLVHSRSDKCKIIVVGSGAEYDKKKDIFNVSEDEWLSARPTDPYGRAKHQISNYILSLPNIINLRAFGIYGLYEHPTRLSAYVIDSCLHNEDIILRQNSLFDFIYVKDLCKIISHFVDVDVCYKFINVCPDESIETLSFAKLIASCFPSYKNNIHCENSICSKSYTGDNRLLHSVIPSLRFSSYKEGVYDYLHDLGILNVS